MAHLIWSPQAADDLEAVCQYIARDSEEYARTFARRILALTDTIAEFPQAGRVVPEMEAPDLRERVVGHYRVIYRTKPDAVEIVTIIHGARLLRET